MGLKPLEFADCLTDSPLFRTNLNEHERELDRTSKAIKTLIHHGKQVFDAAKHLSKAQRAFAKDLREFDFECIDQQTDDEIIIASSLGEFGKYIDDIEDLREQIIDTSEEQFVKRLEGFRKENLGAAKEEKKNFDKQTSKFCQSQERYLGMKVKIGDSQLKEADAQVEMEKRGFYQSSMKYVLKLQEVQEKKKFEFVEALLEYMLIWLTFYHQGYESFADFRQIDTDLRLRLQKTRENFDCAREQAEKLMSKMLETRGSKPMDQSNALKGFTRQGYLYLLEKKPLGTSWTKYYCSYKKETKEFFMILYNQTGGKMGDPEKLTLDSCTRRATDSIERRFCFDLTIKEKQATLTFQALSDEDRKLWLDAMDGVEPIYQQPTKAKADETQLDEYGFTFMKKGIAAIEARGLDEQGLYRTSGVTSKINSLLKTALDPKKADKLSFDDPCVWDTKTITSAIKAYLRSLPEPVLTFKLHDDFIRAAKQDCRVARTHDVHKYCHMLPKVNFDMLDMLIGHLKKVSEKSDENKMTVDNLGVCFGPTLIWPEEQTLAAIMDIKFCNIIVELLVNNHEKIFKTKPEESDAVDMRASNANTSGTPGSPWSHTGRFGNHTKQVSSTPGLGREGGAYAQWGQSSRIYANQAPVHPSKAGRPRPLQVTNPMTDAYGSSNNTSDSHSSKSGYSPRPGGGATPSTPDRLRRPSSDLPVYGNVSALASRFSANVSADSSPTLNSSGHSANSRASVSSTGSKSGYRDVITRYPCKAEHDSELSFEANQIIKNVRPSREPGWLHGELDGKTGLIPENYVETIDS